MKKVFSLLIAVILLIILTGCGCAKKKVNPNTPVTPTPITPVHHFDYDEEMLDNPSEWPTNTFFEMLPSVASTVDDLTITNIGENDRQIYTMTIKSMPYETFKQYAERLMDVGFLCTRAGYWLPDYEKDLSSNYAQCVADKGGVYVKAYWYKPSAASYSFQMSVANFNMDI